MSKSQPSTTTVQNSNPEGMAQQQYLEPIWQAAAGLSGNTAYTLPMQAQAQALYGNTTGPSTGLMPGAMGDISQWLGGTFNQGNYAGGPQIGALNTGAGGAIGTGLGYGNQISAAANAAPGTVAPYQSDLTNVGNQFMGMSPYGQAAYSSLTGMAPGALSSLSGIGNAAIGAANAYAPQALYATQPAAQGLYGSAATALAGNPAYSSGLQGLASGQYLNPNTNPALGGVIQAATQPLINQYQTAVQPGISSQAEAAGRYGSGSQTNQQGLAQYGLGQALSNATSQIVNQNYLQGLQQMGAAGTSLGNIYNTGVGNVNQALSSAGGLNLSGVTGAANIANQGYGTGGGLVQGGYGAAGNLVSQGAQALSNVLGTGLGGAANAYSQGGNLGLGGLNTQIGGLGSAAGAANAGYGTGLGAYGTAGNLANTGQLNLGGIAQMTPDIANFPLSEMATALGAQWAPLQNAAGVIGAPIGGNTTSTQTAQNYSSIPMNVLAGLGSIATLAKLLP